MSQNILKLALKKREKDEKDEKDDFRSNGISHTDLFRGKKKETG